MVQDAIDQGAEHEELVAAFQAATDESGELLADELKRRRAQMLREHRAIRRGMQRRMRALWGPAFDAFYEVYVCAEEIGSDLQQVHGGAADPLMDALLGLHARVCLLLAELHTLMVGGFPLGAWARTRSLHETAVVATLLSDYGRTAGTEDLGERFLAHAVVDQARDLELLVQSGFEVDEEVLTRVRDEHAAVIARYGQMFAKDYGWARPLFPSIGRKEPITFRKLEELADTGLDRFDYRVGGHHIHASAWTVALNAVPRGTAVYRLTGPTNVDFGEPASVALAAALTSTAAIVHGTNALPEPLDLVRLSAMRRLSVRATELFSEAQALVDEREWRQQA